MKSGFKNTSIIINTHDGADDVLLEALYFTKGNGAEYRAPVGSTTDGLSTPRIIRNLPGYDSTGDDWLSGVLHDSAYRDFLEINDPNQGWMAAHLSQKQSDDLILDAMTSQDVHWLRRSIIYYALRCLGCFAFKSDRKKAV